MTDRDDRIRELAYFLWLEERCPEGQAERHWQTAETLFDSEQERKRIEGEPPVDAADELPTESGLSGAGATSRTAQRSSIPSGKDQ